MKRYGYLGDPISSSEALLTEEAVVYGLMKLQTFGGIPVTGKIDEATLKVKICLHFPICNELKKNPSLFDKIKFVALSRVFSAVVVKELFTHSHFLLLQVKFLFSLNHIELHFRWVISLSRRFSICQKKCTNFF